MIYDFIRFVNVFKFIEYELLPENEKLVIDYKKREKELASFMNNFLINNTFILWDDKGDIKIPPSIFIQKFLEILKEYLNYTNLEYFSIPVIGKISSGKSTFLNSLLGIDCLESATKITTKFICIIRHNEDNETPRLFPAIKVERKSKINPKAINFIKDEKNELKGDLKEHIKNINQKIEKCENLEELPIEEFFYILEAKLDIFKGENFIYSKMFEFLDVPGLNEIKEFYLQRVIPYITPNTHFSIFLFDAGGSEDEGSKVLFNKFIHLMNSKTKKNSFFIYNKLDKLRNSNLGDLNEIEEKKVLYFKNDILFREYKLKLKNNHLIGLDSLQLKYDKRKNQNFKDYVLAYIKSIPKRNNNNKFNLLLINKITEEFKIEKFEIEEKQINESKTEEDEKNLNEVNKALKAKYYPKIDINFYVHMKILFNLNNKSVPNGENKVEKFNELFLKFNKSFKDTVQDFVGNKNLILLIKTFNTLLIRLYEMSNKEEEKEHIKRIIFEMYLSFRSILYPKFDVKEFEKIDDDIIIFQFFNFEFEIKNIFDWNKETIMSLYSNLTKLNEFNSQLINKITLNVQNVLNYFNYKKIRITFIGQEYTGKSSILNHIIGKNILPFHEKNKNSNINLIFQANNNYNYKEIKLYKAKINLIDNYIIFEKNDDEAIAFGYEDVKNKLIELKKKETNFENSFYILNIPIIFFKLVKIDEEILNRFEIIYISGKYIKDLEFGSNKKLETIIKYTDSFVYVEKESNISVENFQYLKKIIYFISTINPSFNLEKFLYLINKCTKEDLTKTIINPLHSFLPRISWFSISDYEIYLNIKNLVREETIFFVEIIKKIKENGKNNLLNNILKEIKSLQKLEFKTTSFQKFIINTFFDIILSKQDKVINTLKLLLVMNSFSNEDLENNAGIIIKIAAEFIFLQKGIYNHVSNHESNSDNFLSDLYNLIFNTKYYLDYNLKITIENTKDYLKTVLSLIDKKILEKEIQNSKYYFSSNNEEKKLLEAFENYFKGFKETLLKDLEEYINKFILFIENLYDKKISKGDNVDKLIEMKEDIYFYPLLDKLSKYNEVYETFLRENKLTDISLSSKIFMKDYNRGIINKESIKSKFKFGWFILYNIKNKGRNKYILPESIKCTYKNSQIDEKKNKEYYQFRLQGIKYFINNVLDDIYSEMKNNLMHIIQLKSENFEKIKENDYKFIQIYIDLFDLFDEDDDDDEKEDIKENK